MRRTLVLLTLACAALAAAGAGSASRAAPPRFAVWDLQRDLAPASHDAYGDVKPWRNADALAVRAPQATLVRCTFACGFGDGWFAFSRTPELRTQDVVRGSVRAVELKGKTWAVTLRLTWRGLVRWRELSHAAERRMQKRGVPDVLVFVVHGTVVSAPFSTNVRTRSRTVRIVDLRRTDALQVANLLEAA